MRNLFGFLIALFMSLITVAQPPKGTVAKGTTFGAKTDERGAVNVNDILQKLNSETETNVKVKGKVVDVCTAMGCWLKMETADGPVMVKMKDHAFFVPTDLKGKEIVVAGTAKTTVTPVSELKHYAEDAGKSKDEIAAITHPKNEIVITAKGLLVR
jgi:hypothetical protein